MDGDFDQHFRQCIFQKRFLNATQNVLDRRKFSTVLLYIGAYFKLIVYFIQVHINNEKTLYKYFNYIKKTS